MCGMIIEILFLIAGLWLIISGKIPAGLFKVLFGKGQYITSSTNARLFGLLLASPLPIVFLASFLLSSIFGQDGLLYSVFFENGYIIVVGIIAIIVARKYKQPEIAPEIKQPN